VQVLAHRLAHLQLLLLVLGQLGSGHQARVHGCRQGRAGQGRAGRAMSGGSAAGAGWARCLLQQASRSALAAAGRLGSRVAGPSSARELGRPAQAPREPGPPGWPGQQHSAAAASRRWASLTALVVPSHRSFSTPLPGGRVPSSLSQLAVSCSRLERVAIALLANTMART
jgi:hypothetical protein